jgi:N-acetyl-gamma-glutamyl-phosphate reductase
MRLTVITASIIGASGYSGAEVLRLLSSRADIRVEKVYAGSSAGRRVEELYPVFADKVDLVFENLIPEDMPPADVTFVALPSGEAMNVVPGLVRSGRRTIDLGGDFRLGSAAVYEKFYHHEHTAPEFLSQAVYGLPELNKESIEGARLIANPGCYPTSAILGLLPALKHGIISPAGMIINSLSGVSGAGRSASVELSFAEVNENIRAYKIGSHQHNPEIVSVLESASGKEVSLSFVPHLVPLTRGIYTTIHARLDSTVSEQEILTLYESFYEHEPFVRIKREIPQIKNVVHTNYCDIGITLVQHARQLVIISVIDNLLKGAAGQAVQNMNIMFGLPETQGLV